jgi:hypothetical protein
MVSAKLEISMAASVQIYAVQPTAHAMQTVVKDSTLPTALRVPVQVAMLPDASAVLCAVRPMAHAIKTVVMV